MKIIKNNKGIIIFYLCIVAFVLFISDMAEKNNDKMMMAKNDYIISNN